jgi:transcriptional regulator with XRE-family HTH domain
MPKRSPRRVRDIDLHLGERLRTVRQQRQMSQTNLADALGITFQQVQKYERGAARLFDMSQVLGVSFDFFFEGLAPEVPVRKRQARSRGGRRAVA